MRGRAIRWLLPLVLLATVGIGGAIAASTSMRSSTRTVDVAKSAKYGMILVTSSGRTLYRYTVDTKGVNKCTAVAVCAKYWPRLLVKGTAKPTAGSGASTSLLGTIKQSKGMSQVSYAGFALYTYAGDQKPGDVNGQGFEGKWYVVNTKGALVKHAVSTAASTTAPPSTSSWA